MTTSVPPPDAAVGQDRHAAVDRLQDLRQDLDRRRHRVELASAVVGDDQAVDALLRGAPGIGRVEHPFEEDRQLRDLTHPRQVFPAQGGVEELIDELGQGRSLLSARQALEVGVLEQGLGKGFGRQAEVVAHVGLAPAHDRHVDRHHQGLVSRRLGPLDHGAGDAAVAGTVELEPQVGVAGRGDVLEAPRGQGADGEHRPGRRRSPGGGELGLGVGEGVECRRREEHGRRQRATEQLDAGVDLRDVDQGARQERQALESPAVLGQADLVVGTAGHVTVVGDGELLPREILKIR